MTEMTKTEIRKFLTQSTFTAKLATVKKNVHTLFRFGLYWTTEKAEQEKEWEMLFLPRMKDQLKRKTFNAIIE